MTIVDPPKVRPPEPPPHDDEALIEEARRRARRRRLAYAGAGVLALAAGGTVVAVLSLSGRQGKTSAKPPPGFVAVKAEGPVAHVLVEHRWWPHRWWPYETTTNLLTGRDRPARNTEEIWYDPRSGRMRVVGRVDGRKQFDVAGRDCQTFASGPIRHLCFPPSPFDLLRTANYKWPLDRRISRVTGTGTFRGRKVVWVQALLNGRPPPGGGNRVALDARTHLPVVVVVRFPGGMLEADVFTWMKSLPANGFSFVVPKGGDNSPNGIPPFPDRRTIDRPSSLRAARTALGRTPLWLGTTFRGHRLGTVTVGDEVMRTKTEQRLVPARLVRFNYGDFELWVFGSTHPFYLEQGPRPGYAVRDSGQAWLSRDGLLVLIVRPDNRLTRASVLAIAKALRPLPASP